MMNYELIKTWMVAAFLAIFITACATSQEEIIEDGPPIEDMSTDPTEMPSDKASSDGVDASGVGDADADDVSAIADEAPKTAQERLQEADGSLSNRTIYFEFDSAKLSDESLSMLEIHGSFIAANGEVSVRLEGHADERGSREYNIGLGDRRAQSVRRVLLFQGASVDQIDTISYGEERPVVAGHNEEAWSKNRRVELVYTVN